MKKLFILIMVFMLAFAFVEAKDMNARVYEFTSDSVNVNGVLTAGSILGSVTFDGDIDGNGYYLYNSQTITNLASNGAGYYFDGVDDKIKTEALEILDYPFSVNLVFKFENFDNNQIIYSHNNGSSDSYAIGYYESTNQLFVGHTANNYGIDNADEVIGLNTVNLIVVYNAIDSIDLYLNGNQITTDAVSTTFTAGIDGAVCVGSRTVSTPYYFHGTIKKVQLYDVALSDAEVQALYTNANIPYKYENTGETVLSGFDVSDTRFTAVTATAVGNTITTPSGSGGYLASGKEILEIGKCYHINFNYTSTIPVRVIINPGMSLDSGATTFVAEADYVYIRLSGTGTATIDKLEITEAGNIAAYNSSGVGHNQWTDISGNSNHGAVSGALPTALPSNDVQVYEKTLYDTTAFTLPAGYVIDNVTYYNPGDVACLFSAYYGATDTAIARISVAASGVGTATIAKGRSSLLDDLVYVGIPEGDTLTVGFSLEKIEH